MREDRPANRWHYGLLIAIGSALVLFLIYPIALTVKGGLTAPGEGLSLDPIRLALANPDTASGLIHALVIASVVTVGCVVVALPLAVWNARYRFPGKGLLNALVLTPLILPPFVGAIGMRALLGREGALNALLGTHWDLLGDARVVGVIIAEILGLYPIVYLNATAALANVDPALDEAAENLGAGPWRRFLRITLPLIRPGLFAGGTIVFIWSFTELGTPLMFDYYAVTPVQIFFGLKSVEDNAEPYALTVLLLGVAVVAYVIGRAIFGRRGHAMYSKASRAGGELSLSTGRAWLVTAGFGLVSLLAILPHLGVVAVSLTPPGGWYGTVVPESLTLEHYDAALGDPAAIRSITTSLWLSASAMVIDIGLGIVIAYLLVRTSVRGRGVLDALCMMPLAVPGLVMAFGYVAMTLEWPFRAGDPLGWAFSVLGTDPNPFPLLVIAYAVRRLPYIVRSAAAGLEQTSGELEEAAMNLGASRVRAVRSVIVPLIAANLIAGGLLVFAFSMLEVSDSLLLAQKAEHFPITKQIFAFSEALGVGMYLASAMGVWGMALLATTLAGASLLLGRKLGSIFRV